MARRHQIAALAAALLVSLAPPTSVTHAASPSDTAAAPQFDALTVAFAYPTRIGTAL